MRKFIIKIAAACLVYLLAAAFLYHSYLSLFGRRQCFILFNVTLAALGCFVLSRRWVDSFIASLFAGAIYGFGPHILWLSSFNPFASGIGAAVPWLFAPVVFAPRAGTWKWPAYLLVIVPFTAIVCFFNVCARYRLFPLPMNLHVDILAVWGLLMPLSFAGVDSAHFGFYHTGLATVILGVVMMITANRFGGVLLALLGMILAGLNPIPNTPPVIWLAIPAMCGSLAGAIGFQGLARAGPADAKWIAVIAFFAAALAVAAQLLPGSYFQQRPARFGDLGNVASALYGLAAAMLALIAAISRSRFRISAVRGLVLVFAGAVDVTLSASIVLGAVLV